MKKIVNEKAIRPWGTVYSMRRMTEDGKRYGIAIAIDKIEERQVAAWKLRDARIQLRNAMK